MVRLPGARSASRFSRIGDGIRDQDDAVATVGTDAAQRRKMTQVVGRGQGSPYRATEADVADGRSNGARIFCVEWRSIPKNEPSWAANEGVAGA